jgi:uncharacterized membrane protein
MHTKTLVALYDHLSDARATVDDLVAGGVPRDTINLVANDATRAYEDELSRDRNTARHDISTDNAGTGAALGTFLGGLTGLLVGLGAFAIPGVGPIVAAGPIVATLAGAGVGAATGGILGSLTDLGISESEAHTYAEGIRRGGTLVSVKLDEAEAVRVTDIMERHNPVDLETRGDVWAEAGWTRQFDTNAQPFQPAEIAAERERYTVDPILSADEDDTMPENQARRSI